MWKSGDGKLKSDGTKMKQGVSPGMHLWQLSARKQACLFHDRPRD
jgi:hypothetical protein